MTSKAISKVYFLYYIFFYRLYCGKTNQVHPIITILSVFIGGALFGITGIILSLPLAIIMVTTYKYFKEDITDVISDMKEKNEEKSKRKKKQTTDN